MASYVLRKWWLFSQDSYSSVNNSAYFWLAKPSWRAVWPLLWESQGGTSLPDEGRPATGEFGSGEPTLPAGQVIRDTRVNAAGNAGSQVVAT